MTCKTSAKVLHFCMSMAIFSTIPHVLFVVLSSPLIYRTFPCVCVGFLAYAFPLKSNVMLFNDGFVLPLLITCPIHFHCLVINIVPINKIEIEHFINIRRSCFCKWSKLFWKKNGKLKSERVIISKNYNAGDLNMIDIDEYLKSININWEQTFINNENQSPNWKVLHKF